MAGGSGENPLDSASSFMALMARMNFVLSSISNNINKSSQLGAESKEAGNLEERLKASKSAADVSKILSRVISRGVGGSSGPAIRVALQRAVEARKHVIKAKSELAKFNLHPKGTSIQRWEKRANLNFQIYKKKEAYKSWLSRGKKAALGSKGISEYRSGLTAARARHRVAMSANLLVGAFSGLKKVINAAQETVHRYSPYSPGGMKAEMIGQIGDVRRDMATSHLLSKSMIEFSNSYTKMKDSFGALNLLYEQGKLKLGSLVTNTLTDFNENMKKAGEKAGHFFDDAKEGEGGWKGWLKNAANMFIGDPVIREGLGLNKKSTQEKTKLDKMLSDWDKALQNNINMWKPPQFGLNPDKKALQISRDYIDPMNRVRGETDESIIKARSMEIRRGAGGQKQGSDERPERPDMPRPGGFRSVGISPDARPINPRDAVKGVQFNAEGLNKGIDLSKLPRAIWPKMMEPPRPGMPPRPGIPPAPGQFPGPRPGMPGPGPFGFPGMPAGPGVPFPEAAPAAGRKFPVGAGGQIQGVPNLNARPGGFGPGAAVARLERDKQGLHLAHLEMKRVGELIQNQQTRISEAKKSFEDANGNIKLDAQRAHLLAGMIDKEVELRRKYARIEREKNRIIKSIRARTPGFIDSEE